jgi:hypothetical protein
MVAIMLAAHFHCLKPELDKGHAYLCLGTAKTSGWDGIRARSGIECGWLDNRGLLP